MRIDKDKSFLTAVAELRRHAEERLHGKKRALHPPHTDEDALRLVHELEVQQIELEMQNEELRRAKEELELSRNRYVELYDFAPVGYFTFDTAGLIREVNHTGAQLLGLERCLLESKPFNRFIAGAEGREIFSSHLEIVLQKKGIQKCEISLTGKDGATFHAKIQSVAVESIENFILSSIVDSTASLQLKAEAQDARKYAESIVETVREPLVVLDSDLKILTANHSFYETFKVRPEQTIGNFIYDLGNRQWDIPKLRVLLEEMIPLDTIFNGYEVEHDFLNIGRKTILLNARQIFRENIGSHIILLAMEDVTERKQIDNLLKASLKEKEVLLKEIHHRVKNNLQIVSSILELQAKHIKDERVTMAFKESQNRIDTMALIHEKLYRSKDMARINFSEYIEELTANLMITHGINQKLIQLKISVPEIYFDVNTSIPCGLIINELVSNALKYAFPKGKKGEINISLQPAEKDKYVLVISDNGVGFPDGTDFKDSKTLGLKLVTSLTNQLEGVLELIRDNGTTVKITFSELKYKERI